MMRARSLATVCLGVALLHIVSGLPKIVVTSGRPKCVNVQAAQQTVLRIHYEAPGTNMAGFVFEFSPSCCMSLENYVMLAVVRMTLSLCAESFPKRHLPG